MGKTSPTAIEVAELTRKALDLRKAGLNYERIAATLQISKSRAWQLVNRAIKEITAESAEELVKLEAARLDDMFRAMWVSGMEGKGWAIDRLLAIMERRARLFGLDQPQKHSVAVISEDAIDAEIRRLTEELGRNDALFEARQVAAAERSEAASPTEES